MHEMKSLEYRKAWIFISLLSTWMLQFCSATDLADSLSEIKIKGCEGEGVYLRCPFSTYIHITHAEFGRRLPSSIICPYKHLPQYRDKPFSAMNELTSCSAPNAKENVESLCQERRVCRLKASVRAFYPDPCPDTGKYLKVSYKCIPATKITETKCVGDTLSLSCDKGKRLFLSTAQYGYDDLIPQTCSSPSDLRDNKNIGCLSSTAESIVKERCHNRRSCSINIYESVFGRLCPGIGKYLKVSYICVPKSILNTDGTISEEDIPPALSDTEVKTGASTLQDDEDCNCTVPSDHDHSQKDPSLVFSWVHSTTYIKDNQEKLILYGMLCGCLAFICALIVFIARMFYVRYKKTKRSITHQKLNVTEPAIQDISNEENTYIAAGDPSDMAVMQSYNLAYNRGETTNRLGSGPSSYRGSSNNRVFNADPETQRFNTNSLTVTNPLHNPHLAEHHRNFNNSPLTTTSTAMNNSPNTALSDNRNTYYENSGDDEHTNDDNSAIRTSQLLYNRPGTSSTGGGPDVRPRTNSLFDRHS